MPLTSTADVATDAPARYAKQLASHLGRRLEIVEEDQATRVVFADGECRMTSRPGSLLLEASAADIPTLDLVEDVVGRHLEKFGQRAGLTVVWTRG